MSATRAEHKIIANAALAAFGGSPRVTRFWDDNRASSVDILSCENRPQTGVTSYSTIGLSDAPLYRDGKEFGTRLEMVGACGSGFAKFDNVLASAAFYIINSTLFCFPGAIFNDVVAIHDCSRTMRHLLFLPPFIWENQLGTIDLATKKVAWLLAVPISEEERAFANSFGTDRLEALFEREQIDIFNLERPSVM